MNGAPVKPEDICCASAACDIVRDCNGQITGSHLARVAQLFADHRAAQALRSFEGIKELVEEAKANSATPWKQP